MALFFNSKPVTETAGHYGNILNQSRNFRNYIGVDDKMDAGYKSSVYDEPNRYFFKLIFYFDQDGLLCDDFDDDTKNSAYWFLMKNAEFERADLLKHMIQLLKDININFPWYFQKVSGLDSAAERSWFNGGVMKLPDDRPVMSISCLPDSKDDKIGTILDMYRAICFSDAMKKEIVPINLRRFDMGIMIYSVPCKNLNTTDAKNTIVLCGGLGMPTAKNPRQVLFTKRKAEEYTTSSKYLELHNCEFVYKSAAALLKDLNNEEGFRAEYSIDISFDQLKENRFNEFILKNIGDFIIYDQNPWLDPSANTTEKWSVGIDTASLARTMHEKESGFLENTVNAVAGHFVNDVTKIAKRIVLGNIYHNDLGNVITAADNIMNSNNLIQAGQEVDVLIRNRKEKSGTNRPTIKNIYYPHS